MIDVNSLKIIAVLESADDKSIWLKTKSFEQSESVQEIVDWALRQHGKHGNLILTIEGLNRL
jgi:hypothetical protein